MTPPITSRPESFDIATPSSGRKRPRSPEPPTTTQGKGGGNRASQERAVEVVAGAEGGAADSQNTDRHGKEASKDAAKRGDGQETPKKVARIAVHPRDRSGS